MLIGGLSLAGLAAFVWWRARYLRVTEATVRRRPMHADGVVCGAEGFVLGRPGAPAILLLHGAGDTPQTLRYLAGVLYDRGFHIVAPLLPGHGRSIRDFSHVTADALSAAARQAYHELRGTHDWVAVIGLSMGGALAGQLAADNPDLPALGLLAPYLAMPQRIERFARLAWLWGPIIPVVRSGDGISVLDPDERERSLAYGVFTPSALTALRITMRRAVQALPAVTAPTIMVQSRSDNRISVADAERAFALLGAAEKRLEWITGAAHVITVDYGKDRVAALLSGWMERRTPGGTLSH
ncbi:MAG: alpha/beta fold hydrolase [bacterium]